MSQSTLKLFETHCHLDVTAFDSDRNLVLQDAHAAGVDQILIPAIQADNFQQVLDLCNQREGLYPALGMHPCFMPEHKPEHLQILDDALTQYKPAAVGEIGLDFYIDDPNKDVQIELFDAQLKLAIKHDLPVVLHVRKAHEEVLKLLKKNPVKGGFCHAFNGSLQQAERYISSGFKLGFGGMLTFERSSKLRSLAKELPIEALVLETDAPDMSVVSHKGERNSPAYLPEILQALAKVRGENPDSIAAQTSLNAREVLGLT